MGEHGKPARQAFPADLEPKWPSDIHRRPGEIQVCNYTAARTPDDSGLFCNKCGFMWSATNARLTAAMDLIDRLRTENEQLKERGTLRIEGGIDADLHVRSLAELRSLKAVVARVADATGEHIIGDEPWRAAFKALLALVPLDGSWETEQTTAGERQPLPPDLVQRRDVRASDHGTQRGPS